MPAAFTTGRSRLSPKPGHPVLDLGHGNASDRDALIITDSNREAAAWIDRWPDWPVNGLTLAGGLGCGKTHLASVWQKRTGATAIDAKSFGEARLSAYLQNPSNILIDGADRCCESRELETSFFHLFNGARAAGKSLLLVAGDCPARWPIKLPDLRSRLQSLPCATIAPPDDAMLLALLAKLFADRQVRVGDDVLAYIVARIERSCRSIQQLVEQLDKMALARQAAITIPLVKSVLDAEFNPPLPL